jgi:hypothetical protein
LLAPFLCFFSLSCKHCSKVSSTFSLFSFARTNSVLTPQHRNVLVLTTPPAWPMFKNLFNSLNTTTSEAKDRLPLIVPSRLLVWVCFFRVEFRDQPGLISQATSMGSLGQVSFFAPPLYISTNLILLHSKVFRRHSGSWCSGARFCIRAFKVPVEVCA